MMEKIESIWKVGIRFNEVHFVGIAPKLGGIFGNVTEQALITKALDYIKEAQAFAECMPISEPPQGMNVQDNNTIAVGFTIMFKEPQKAKQFLDNLQR